MHLVNGSIHPKFISERLESYQNNPTNGAHSIFLGQVRSDSNKSSIVEAIEYEAYLEMAEKEIDLHIKKTIKQYSVDTIEVYHSVGLVKTGSYSILIIVNSGHRKATLDALTYLVERIKYDVPIWKKELFSNGNKQWVNEHKKRESNA